MKRWLIVAILWLLPAMASAAPLQAFVSVAPEATFVSRVGGAHVAVDVLVGPGQSPHSYEPTPRQMADLARARVFFRIGVPFEDSLVAKIGATFPDLKVVDLREGVRLVPSGDEHEDPHIWMDPRRVKTMAATIAAALTALDRSHAAEFAANRDALAGDLDALDAELRATLAPDHGRAFMVFHPAYGYFADAYGLRQVAIEAHGKDPSARTIAAWIDQARAEAVKTIFVQPQMSDATARTIAASVGARVVSLDPLAIDYFANMRAIARAIAAAE